MFDAFLEWVHWEAAFLWATVLTAGLSGTAAWRHSRRLALLALLPAAVALAPWLLLPRFGELLRRAMTTNIVATNPNASRPEELPRSYSQPPAEVSAAAERAVRALGWHVASTDATTGTLNAEIAVYSFTDDFVVTVTPKANGSEVNVRSSSRVGKGDVGENRRHVLHFWRALEQELGK